MAITLVNTLTGETHRCTGLWAEHTGDDVVFGFENTLLHQAQDLNPPAIVLDGFDEWPWGDDEEIATRHKVLPPWRVLT